MLSLAERRVLRHAPLLVYFADGATLELPDCERALAALGTAGHRAGLVARLQQWWSASLVALVLLLAGIVLAYTHGLPAAAEWVTAQIPPGFEQELGTDVLAALDESWFDPSQLDEDRRETLRQRFAEAAARAAPGVDYRLRFRRGDDGIVVGGFNAFALPGGDIVVLDGLVDNGSDLQVLGVLGHELGHVARRHAMRNVVQTASLGVLAGLLWGDVSGILANAPVLVGALHYSREFEREADAFAIDFMTANGHSTAPLVEMLEKMQRAYGADAGAGPDVFSTHPSLQERIEFLRGAGP